MLLSMRHWMVLMILRVSITVFSMSQFDSLSPFHCVLCGNLCSAYFINTISARKHCWLRVALQCDPTINKQIHEVRHSLDCPSFSIPFCIATLLMRPLCLSSFHCDACHGFPPILFEHSQPRSSSCRNSPSQWRVFSTDPCTFQW